ncbi:hypothetical protein QQF64_006408 [Cirrhinus molitorella]|uniref:Uncharacterized protein n=1 Tax=Cirrhinus molitorella TaxID=172907 RepID=A0ABR3MI27_9TELE
MESEIWPESRRAQTRITDAKQRGKPGVKHCTMQPGTSICFVSTRPSDTLTVGGSSKHKQHLTLTEEIPFI